MNRPLTIVTGSSRGLGLALAQALLQRGHLVLAIARGATPIADAAPGRLVAWQQDLADSGTAAARLEAWLTAQDGAALASATLINNAGVVSDPAPLAAGRADELARALRVGLEAPLLLTAAFLRASAGWALARKVLLVSSGLGRRGMAGSASYCAAKAGLDNLARAVALEEAARPDGARIVSLAPGVIDTDMQAQLRHADPARFPERAGFVALKEQGRLDSPSQAAEKVLRFLARSDYGARPVTDLRELDSPDPAP
ncbi:MAG: SDR family NAD(P)-dependent oxidoreductase [Burkholderiales bacterium]|nr:SDR family NAD(P)-dependent oxidoreductase [Burkholderiales bacterium]MDE1928233.1 SDR family NAD(P)-dependent oxidoreductase [Burkholderiales bacterium]MDE2160341.1 SDR family NAD(P)-dependent oxidoreductase [Burkholderiales bacterium]MDE2504561.1 SDR family NAD(P)-dependent oxidoreductase [Burkholderiales bacterium]